MFTVKNIAEEEMGGGLDEEDDFKTDEEEEMELDKPVPPKRKKVCKSISTPVFKGYFFLNL